MKQSLNLPQIKKFVLKITAVFISAFIIFCPCLTGLEAFAFVDPDITIAESNYEFARLSVQSANEVTQNISLMRIIGRTNNESFDYDKFDAKSVIVCNNGRFIMQFSSEEKLASALKKLQNLPEILYAEQDAVIYTTSTESVVDYCSWGPEAIGANLYSQSVEFSAGESKTVAIIDSGCADIANLKDKLVSGYDFVDNDNDATNDESVDSHGTFLASIVADCTQNLPIKIMPVRVLSSKSGSLINAVNGVFYAADTGADIINISLGGELNNCSALDDAIKYADLKNALVVVAAGNAVADTQNYCPAHNACAVTVTSVNSNNAFSAGFSNYGNEIDLAAPGEGIGGYDSEGNFKTMNGTSMAAAFVSAAAAMFRLQNPACNTIQVHDSLCDSTIDFGETGWDKYYGHGILNLNKLLEEPRVYVNCISFESNEIITQIGEAIEPEIIFCPQNATDKSYILSSSDSNIYINENKITLTAEGIATIKVTSNDGKYTDTCIVKDEKTYRDEKVAATVTIRTPSATKISYGDSILLHADTEPLPEGWKIVWTADNSNFQIDISDDAKTCTITPQKSGDTIFTATVYDLSGNKISSDEQIMTSNAGLISKIIAFFKKLFNLTKVIVQEI